MTIRSLTMQRRSARSSSTIDSALTEQSSQAALEPVLGRIARFATLETDWDGHGAKIPTEVVLQQASELVRHVFIAMAGIVGDDRAIPSWVSPLPSGGVQIDWNGTTAELEVDVGPQGTIGYLLTRGQDTSATFDEGDDITADAVLALLDNVLRP